MICDCKCHQMPEETSSCMKCKNTGLIDNENKPLIPITEKPIFEKNSLSLENTKKLKDFLI